jgi:hypothetical protein
MKGESWDYRDGVAHSVTWLTRCTSTLVIVFALLLSKDPCVKQTSKPLVTANVLFLRRLGTRIKHLVAGTLKSSGAVM